MIEFKSLFRFSSKEIAYLFNHSKLTSQAMGLRILQAHDLFGQTPEVGHLLIITPRSCGKANIRNKLRRRLKYIFYTKQLYKNPIISIVIANKKAAASSYQQLENFLIKNILKEEAS